MSHSVLSTRSIVTQPPRRLAARSPRAALLQELFSFFHRRQVPYCVLGDPRDLPYDVRSDVDLVVASEVLPGLPAMLRAFCRTQQAQLVQVIQHEPTAFFCVLTWQDREGGQRQFLQVDICGDYYRSGKRLLTAEELLRGREQALSTDRGEGFYIPAPEAAFLYYLLKKTEKQDLDDRQGAYLSAQWRRSPAGVERQISRFWPEDQAALLAAAAAANAWEDVRQVLPALRKALHRHLRPSLPDRWRELRRHAGRIRRPTGLWVAFLGPDGSGKSSVIARVLEDLTPCFWRTTSMHLRPSLGQRPTGKAPVVAPHSQAARGALPSLAKLLYYLLDYTAGYQVKVRPRLIRATLVVFDRYYQDLLVDPKRYRYGGPGWLARAVSRLLPQPDLFIFLDAPPEIVHTRKQEVSFEETARQRRAYLLLAQGLPGSHVVNAALPLQQVAADVEQIILQAMSRRAAGGAERP